MAINDSSDLPLSPATVHLWAIEQAATARRPRRGRASTRIRRLVALLGIAAGSRS